MQYFAKQRATETGDVTTHTPAIDVGGMALLTFELIVYRLVASGSPVVAALLQTSNDLETWSAVSGVDATLSAEGSDSAAARAFSPPYGKYVRFEITVTGGVTELEYSVVLNTFTSS